MAGPPQGPQQGTDYRKGGGHSLPPPKTTTKKKGPVDLGPAGAYTAPNKNQKATYLAWAKKNGIAPKVAADIWYWGADQAGRANLDAQQFTYYWSAVLLAESHGHHLNKYGQIVDSGQAVGIGQIAKSWIGQHIPWEPVGVNFTGDNDPRTGIGAYGVNIRFSAYLLADGVAHQGYDGAYLNSYNPHDPNKQKAWAAIQKTLKTLPQGVGPLAPTEGPGTGAAPGNNPDQASKTNPYIAGVKNGKVIPTSDPTKAVTYDGAPMQLSDWQALSRHLDSYFVSYTGGRPSNQVILNYINKGWGEYQLTVALSKGKNFKNSPIYKKYYPEYVEALKNVLAPGETVLSLKTQGKKPQPLIQSAIVNGWDPATFAAVARQRPEYVQSNEFRGNTAALLNVHASIMGNPDEKSMGAIKQAALAGWDANQYAAYLRSQPQYVESPEYQSKTLSFLGSIGLITGEQPVLKKGQADVTMNPNPGGFGPLPNDKRLPAGKLTNAEDTVATYGG